MNPTPSEPVQSVTVADSQSPWLGLASFTEETRAYFHGRDEEVAELGRRVQRKLLTVLFGQSGLGKTSILRAGIVPRLRPEGFCPVYVRIDYGPDSPPPAEQIKQAIFRATAEAGQWSGVGSAREGETLWEFLHHRDDVLRDVAGRTLVPLLIFDQFEEVFTLAQGDDFGRRRAALFLEELGDLVENRAPRALEARLEADEAGMEKFDFARADYRILIALREDYLAHLEGLKAAMPSVTQNRMRLARMTGAQALAAVTGPGRTLVSVEVAAQIVMFVSGARDLAHAEVEPSLLSLVCRELNETRRARGHAEISADLLAGSRDTILTEFYERTLADQPEGVRAFIEDELLTDSGYRESIAEERVKKGFVAAGAPAEAVATLIDRRLLRVEERLDVRRVELTHDVLCGVVRASRDVRQAREAKTAAERLLAETQAKEAASRGALHRARMVAAGCVVLAVGAAGAAIWGYVNFRRAEAAEDRAAQERDRVQASRAEAEKLVTFLLDDLHRQLEPTGKIEIVSGLARRALGYFDALPAELRDDRSERYRAVALSRLGSALSAKGKTLEAEEPLLQAETIFKGLRDRGDRSTEVVLDLAAVLRQTSRNAYAQNRSRAAVDIGRRGADLIGPAAAAADAPVAVRYEHGRTQMNLGFVLMRNLENGPALTSFEQATTVFRQLRDVPEARQRAEVMLAETSVWLAELLRLTGRGAEVDPLLTEAMQLAEEAVQREAGNLAALRSRGLVRGRLAVAAFDAGDNRKAEVLAQQTTADWTEFLRFDPDNETARNNRRVGQMGLAGALWRQGRLDEVVTLGKAMLADAMGDANAPSTVRGAAFQTQRYGGLAAELGRVADAEAALVGGNRLRNLAASQLEPESFFRAATPVWNEVMRAVNLQQLGRSEEALAVARAEGAKLSALIPVTGAEQTVHNDLVGASYGTQLLALLELRQWTEASRVGRALLQGRPRADDTSVGALDELAEDRSAVAVALARVGERAETRALIEQVETFFRGSRRRVETMDHVTRFQLAQLGLSRGLIAEAAEDKRTAFKAALAEIAAMPPQPQQMRSTKLLKAELERELAAVK